MVKARSAFDLVGREHAGWREAWVVDEGWVVVAHPLGAIGRVGDYGVEGLVVKVHGVGERVPASDAELVEVHVMQEHVDAAEVVGGGVYLLAEEALLDAVCPQDLGKLEQQGARAARRVVHFVDARLAADDYAGQKLGDLLRREELAAGLAGI